MKTTEFLSYLPQPPRTFEEAAEQIADIRLILRAPPDIIADWQQWRLRVDGEMERWMATANAMTEARTRAYREHNISRALDDSERDRRIRANAEALGKVIERMDAMGESVRAALDFATEAVHGVDEFEEWRAHLVDLLQHLSTAIGTPAG